MAEAVPMAEDTGACAHPTPSPRTPRPSTLNPTLAAAEMDPTAIVALSAAGALQQR